MHDSGHHHDCNHDHHSSVGDAHCWYRGGPLMDELASHLPFSILSVTVGLIIAGLICFFASDETLAHAQAIVSDDAHQHEQRAIENHNHDHDHNTEQADHAEPDSPRHSGFIILFHLFHPTHMLFSAAATTAMFWRHERRFIKAILIGLTGAVLVCGVSDIAIPYLAQWMMNRTMALHICVIEHPMIVVPFALIGILIGLLVTDDSHKRSTIYSHTMHVGVSTMASIFYMLGPFERLEWIGDIGMIFLYTCIAVVVPCCFSDLVYPFLFTKKARSDFALHGHVHPH